MAALGARPGPLTSGYEGLQGLLDTYGPPELREVRERALLRFEAAGIPTHRDEEWKYTSLRRLEESTFQTGLGATVTRDEVGATLAGTFGGVSLVFVNGQFAPELSDAYALPDGAVVTTFQEAWESLPEHVMEKLGTIATLDGKLGSTNDTRFVDLNTAFLSEGAVVYLGRGVTLDTHVHLVFVSTAERLAVASHPRALVVLEENSEAKLVESYVGLGGTNFSNAVTEVYLGQNARLEHVKVQDETADSVHIANLFVHQESGSVYTATNVSFGGAVARTDHNVWVNGEHCETWLNGTYVGEGEQVADNHTRIDHAKPNCNSFEVYKGILSDKSIGVFNGKIFVYEDAQKTDAKQTNQAILLSPTATINTKPQLEIFADDVKCTHGATVGQLREDAIFYLRARGIPKAQARAILVYAFAAEVLEKIGVEAVRIALEERLFAKLGA